MSSELRKRSKAAAADGSAAAGSSKAATTAELNPITTEFEFMGPYVGSIGILFGLPLLVWASAYFCRGSAWPPLALPAALPTAAQVSAFLPTIEQVKACFSLDAFLVYVCWWMFQALLYLVVPGEQKQGVQLRDGTHLMYPINGWRCLLITLATAAAVHVFVHPLTWIADNFVQLATASIIFSFLLSIYLYASSFVGTKMLAPGGNSRIPIYDFFIGRELNPRILGGRLDLKYFCELRPGLFLWVVINIAMALRQWETLGRIDASMLIVCALQALYVADSVYCEECILTTMDIIMDGFGFMLAFGDLAWVPFMYSLQARYLADQPLTLSPAYAAVCLVVALAGFYIFRAANAQKDTFKKNPEDPSVKGELTKSRPRKNKSSNAPS